MTSKTDCAVISGIVSESLGRLLDPIAGRQHSYQLEQQLCDPVEMDVFDFIKRTAELEIDGIEVNIEGADLANLGATIADFSVTFVP